MESSLLLQAVLGSCDSRGQKSQDSHREGIKGTVFIIKMKYVDRIFNVRPMQSVAKKSAKH